MRFASLKSPSKMVRARLQAALFANRKRNKERRATPASPAPWVGGMITIADVDEGIFPGFFQGFGGSISQPNTDFPIDFMCFYSNYVYISLIGNCLSTLTNSRLQILSFDETENSITFDGTRTIVQYPITTEITLANVGNSYLFDFVLA